MQDYLRSFSTANCQREVVIYLISWKYHYKDGRRMETWSLLLQQWNLLLCYLLRPMWGLQDSRKDWRIRHSLWTVDLLPSLHWWNAVEEANQEEVQHWGIWPRGCRYLLSLHTLCHLPELQRDQRKGGTLKNYCKIIALIALSRLFCLLHKYIYDK